MRTQIKINRAPVLTLWAAVVAQRLGYSRDEAMTLGKAVAGLNAQAKGRRLGIFHPKEKSPEAKRRHGEEVFVEICGRVVPVIQTDQGVRAVTGGKPISPASVEGYLHRSFGEQLDAVQGAMQELATAFPPKELEQAAYGLYEQFRPSIPSGTKG